jgi:hypothetical protein
MSTPVEKVPEPVRKYVYSVLGVLLVAGVAYGLITSEEAVLWASVISTVLMVPAAEAARARVRPLGTGNGTRSAV